MRYYFKPMMPIYDRLVVAPTEWLMTDEARSFIAKSIWFCRQKFGHKQASLFRKALIYVGVIYPLVRRPASAA